MTTSDGDEWGGYVEQPADETAPPPPSPAPMPPGPGSGRPAWTRGPWRIVIAVVGIAAIAIGVIEIVSGSSGSGISKPEFIRRADAICGRLNPKIANDYDTYAADYASGDRAGAQAASIAFETDAQSELDQLKVLPLPTQGAATVNEVLDADQQEIQDLESGPPGSEGVLAAQGVSSRIHSLAQSFGFRVCGIS